MIQVLDQDTINQIAAGEVIERPSSVVKELLENAIDAGATAVTVEIRDGGISFIRVTDNGCGIPAKEVPVAFLRHATSKISQAMDLITVSSLGFRGEALASIAAVSQVELITKVSHSLTGTRYVVEGGEEKAMEEIGAPEGTTFIVRNLFFNTPARKKFLKTPATEGSYIASLVERIALSHPDISIRFIQNNQSRLHTAGNHNLKDISYSIYGREVTSALLPVSFENQWIRIDGFVGKPLIARGNRSYENYFINGRYIKSGFISRAVEEAYKNFLMQHKYPFTILHIHMEPELMDVNVHPTKMEVRFRNGEEVYQAIYSAVYETVKAGQLVPQVELTSSSDSALAFRSQGQQEEPSSRPPVRENFLGSVAKQEAFSSRPEEKKKEEAFSSQPAVKREKPQTPPEPFEYRRREMMEKEIQSKKPDIVMEGTPVVERGAAQMELLSDPQISGKVLTEENRKEFRLIGQLFSTYWLVQWKDQFLIVDQHAAHEKVLYEKLVEDLKKNTFDSQQIQPPIILTLSQHTELTLKHFLPLFEKLGFEIEEFGGKDYAVYAVPTTLYGLDAQTLLVGLLDELEEDMDGDGGKGLEEKISYQVLSKLATMACKAAIKGNQNIHEKEMEALFDQMIRLDNPYFCPHGRPVMIAMSKYELEKKFRRIV